MRTILRFLIDVDYFGDLPLFSKINNVITALAMVALACVFFSLPLAIWWPGYTLTLIPAAVFSVLAVLRILLFNPPQKWLRQLRGERPPHSPLQD